MASVTYIPDSFKEGFELLSSIDSSIFGDIVSGLSLTQWKPSIPKLADTISSVKSLQYEQVKQILYSAGSLLVFVDKEVAIDQLVSDVVGVVERDEVIEDFQHKKESFRERLNTLLASEPLYFAAKSQGLRSAQNYVLVSSRIISDLRPIFSKNVEESPKAAIVIHKLHIHFSAGMEDEHKDIYLALDSDDLTALKEQIERAEKKQKSLISVLQRAQIKDLEA